MIRKLITAICLTLICQFSFADTCPDVNAIKTGKFNGWIAYDSEDETPLSSERVAEFKKYADQFALAEWSKDSSKTSIIRCYYRDKEGSDLEAYLSKDNFAPSKGKVWYEVSGAKQCAAGNAACEFVSVVMQHSQFAKN